jgi:hypothetical protein
MGFSPEQLREIDSSLAGAVGLSLSAFRKSYGRTAHAHLGRLIPRTAAPEKAIHKDRGEFVLDMLDCDRIVTLGGDDSKASRNEGDEPVLKAMEALVGQEVSRVSLASQSLTLRVDFSNGASIALMADMALSSDSEQWALTFPDGSTLVAQGTATLRLE